MNLLGVDREYPNVPRRMLKMDGTSPDVSKLLSLLALGHDSGWRLVHILHNRARALPTFSVENYCQRIMFN